MVKFRLILALTVMFLFCDIIEIGKTAKSMAKVICLILIIVYIFRKISDFLRKNAFFHTILNIFY